jgi:hypothetical protein
MKDSGDNASPLVFHWKRPAPRSLGLAAWVMLTLVGMAAFFYLFKVAYPQAHRFTPVPQQISVLNPDDPAHQALLNRVRDQDYLVITGNEDSSREIHLVDHVPVFHPSYEKHDFQLQDLPRTKIKVLPARVLDPTAPVLPPPDLTGMKPPGAPAANPAPAPPLALGFSGELSKRHLLNPPDLSSLQIADPSSWRFHIGVQPDGRVSYALPLATGDEQKTTQSLLALLTKLKFEPAASATGPESVVWSIVTLHWKMTP